MSKMLIVEDNASLRESYKFLFQKEGYTVDSAVDGAGALGKVREQSYDIVLLDVIMPGVNGIQFLRQFIPANHAETKVIMFSNIHTPDLVNEAISLGAASYLEKATTAPKDLAKIVKDIERGK